MNAPERQVIPGGDRATAPGDEQRTPGRRHPQPRVGYVLTLYPRLSETFIRQEVAALERLGVEVILFSQKRPQTAADRESGAVPAAPRADVVYLDLTPTAWPALLRDHVGWFRRRPLPYLRRLRWVLTRRNRATWKRWLRAGRLAAECRRRGLQHLHAHFLSGNTRLARLAADLATVPYSMTAHAKDIYAVGLSRSKIRRRIRQARFAVTVSDFNRRHLEEIAGEGRITVIRNGVDLDRLRFHEDHGDRRLILAVGRLVPKKGFGDLVEALALLARRGGHDLDRSRTGNDWQAWIVGDGPEKERLGERIAAHDLGGRVRLLGSRSHDELLDSIFPQAALVVVPSVIAADGDRDGLPTVIPEAMAIGVPVVATNVTGIPELVRDDETGRLVEPHDVAGLAAAITELLSQPERRRRLTRAARRLVEEEYDLERSARLLRSRFAGREEEKEEQKKKETPPRTRSGDAHLRLLSHGPALRLFTSAPGSRS